MRDFILNTQLSGDQLALFYLGQEGFLIKWLNNYFLIDAYLSDYVDRNFSTAQVPWVRKYNAPISAEELDFVDYVFCTHPHADHADPDTLQILAKSNAKATYVIPYILKNDLVSFGISPDHIRCMDGDESITLGRATITALPSAHEELTLDDEGHVEALGFIFQLGNMRLYHAGDCCIYHGLSDRLANIDLGLLPINGRDYYRNRNNILGNMDSVEALHLAKQCGVDLLIPMHFDLYAVNEVNPAYFVDNLYKINPTQKFHIFAPGERLLYSKN